MNFQTFVGTQPSPAIAGDFASANPRFSVDAGPGGLVAGPLGLTVGRFAWLSYDLIDTNEAPAEANNFGAGLVAGFVHREQQGLITQFLQESSMFIPPGFAVTLMSGGDFWCKNDGITEATPGMKAYANFADGRISFAATGAVTNASVTGAIAASTLSVTASITNEELTVTAVGSGVVVNGAILAGTNVATGTQVQSQTLPLLAGEALGGIGRYTLSIGEQAAVSETITGTYGTLTVTAVGSGAVGVGDPLSGSGVTTGTTVTQQLTGTAGGIGTYAVSPTQTASSTTITSGTNSETKWFARSSGLAGELVKISSQPLG